MTTLEGKVAIVTGAGGRLGRASVSAMARAGASVLAVDVDAAGAEAAAAGSSGDVRPHTADISEESDVVEMIDRATAEFGGVDILFNNAGLVGLEHGTGLLDIDVEVWDRILAVNLRGTMLGCKHVVPRLLARGGGTIINMSSDSAVLGDVANFAYAASKSGVNILTRYVAASFGKQNVRCNAISPGVHLSDADRPTAESSGFYRSELYALIEDNCLLPRLGRPEDVANLAVFLSSPDAEYITGQIVHVDGGLLAHVPHLAEARRLGGSAY
ncbi:SDR family NAD(P)-dependent oxidoreductase [Mycobacterium sp. NPDC003449]